MEDPSALLTRADVQRILRLGKTRTHELINSEIPSFMIGGSRRVRLSDLQVWINAQAEKSRAA